MARMNQNLSGIGSTICDLSRSLADQLEALKYPEPSFASDAPASLPLDPNLQGTRMQLLETLEVLRHLVTGPSDFWFHESMFVSPAS